MTIYKQKTAMQPLDWIAFSLPIIGGINWGLVGLADFNAVEKITGTRTIPAKIVYGLVGLSALYLAIVGLSKLNHCTLLLKETEEIQESFEELESDFQVTCSPDLIAPKHERV